MADWNNQSPIYLQLADRLSQNLLDGQPPEGTAMPSERERFLSTEWPQLVSKLQRLGITAADLTWPDITTSHEE